MQPAQARRPPSKECRKAAAIAPPLDFPPSLAPLVGGIKQYLASRKRESIRPTPALRSPKRTRAGPAFAQSTDWPDFRARHQTAARAMRTERHEPLAAAANEFYERYVCALSELAMGLGGAAQDDVQPFVDRYTGEMHALDMWRYGEDMPLAVLTLEQVESRVDVLRHAYDGVRARRRPGWNGASSRLSRASVSVGAAAGGGVPQP
ncbi:hypothetical protein DENSPDRAFT_534898 [Dentipellis sp. KUC8613]|nr:hypothetical protein DENSPDRAFT_534898 [Dentipellis sp. KUC8613]